MTRRRGTVIVAVAAVAFGTVVAVGASQTEERGQGEGSVGTGPPPPPPRADPTAGRPAYLADWDDARTLILDRVGRVVRVLPRDAGATAEACPGGRRLVDGDSWWGAVHVRRLDGRTIWRHKIPIAAVTNLECLDPRGRRVAVVMEPDDRPERNFRIVSRRGSRVVMRLNHESPGLTPTRLYVTDANGVKSFAVPTGEPVQELAGPEYPHRVLPSPDGRWLALTHLTDALRFRSFLLDTVTGQVQRITTPRAWLLGWVANDLLALRSDRTLRVLDTTLAERRVVPGFRSAGAVITRRGDVVAVEDRALIRVRRDGDRVERIGRVPKWTSLTQALR